MEVSFDHQLQTAQNMPELHAGTQTIKQYNMVMLHLDTVMPLPHHGHHDICLNATIVTNMLLILASDGPKHVPMATPEHKWKGNKIFRLCITPW